MELKQIEQMVGVYSDNYDKEDYNNLRFKAYKLINDSNENVVIKKEMIYQPEDAFCLAIKVSFIGDKRLTYIIKQKFKRILKIK